MFREWCSLPLVALDEKLDWNGARALCSHPLVRACHGDFAIDESESYAMLKDIDEGCAE